MYIWIINHMHADKYFHPLHKFFIQTNHLGGWLVLWLIECYGIGEIIKILTFFLHFNLISVKSELDVCII